MRRVAIACTVGTTVEFYDFYIYGTAAALVFPTVFFPDLSPTMATIAAMGTFAAAFVSRPLGGAVFGHFGDRIGRKATLVATLLIMGLSTVAVGLTPSAATIGVAAPLLVLVLRLLQGFAVGGEWAGSALLGTEYAPPNRRGWYGMFTPLGVGIALVLTSLTFLLVEMTIGGTSAAFVQWGWRVAFLLSALLIAIALYVRLNIGETPVFTAQLVNDAPSRAPIADVIRGHSGKVALAAGSFVGVYGFVFMGGTYLASYGRNHLGLSPNVVLTAGLLGGLAWTAVVAYSANKSDHIGRRPVMLTGWMLGLPWCFAVLPLIDTGSPVLFTLAIVGIYAIAGLAYAPMTAFVPELFDTRHRYTGAGLALNVAGIIGGALPPIIAGPLLERYGSWAVGVMLAALVLMSLVCIYRLPETVGTSLADAAQ
ncbi:MFS transporter [Mycobacterium intermedium]|uniref:MFS transporter n=1 Tax=Mycobacterium intermedium TaxID=28445 RepID=A0A1E3SD11_MYCIE|nr:MFS transporter [Mycobacterium intermedium]MCV6964100.1 MHS family MFS transporter [Mycobacterium intermedium]ODR00029.1 MFS transporter [Mycobacterium intermedium]OPE51463.1 MFS transporter [Mycobacterium intermedium]ORB09025.1 MFS transporter [Mycobacterium intermedium]